MGPRIREDDTQNNNKPMPKTKAKAKVKKIIKKPAAKAKSAGKKLIRKAVKKIAKKIVKKIAKKVMAKVAKKSQKPIGVVTHFYNAINVAIVRFKENVPTGTALHFRGATTDFKQTVKSMQHNHETVKMAPKGKQIGIKVTKRVREGDEVHKAE